MKVYLKESQIKSLLKEYSNEPRLPFEEPSYRYKNILESFIDWLEDFGRYGELEPSKISFEEGIRSGLATAWKWAYENRHNGEQAKEPSKEDLEDFYDELNLQNFYDNIKFEDYLKKIKEKGVDKGFINDRGQLYVERAIKVPSITKPDVNQKWVNKLKQYYQNNVGGCWSWGYGDSDAYCGSGDDIITMMGYIRMEDIDWVETDYVNNFMQYSSSFEKEIRTKPNAQIELFGLKYTNSSNPQNYKREVKFPNGKTLIVKATYFGNEGKYQGNYARIYDANSKDIKYMDRENKIFLGQDFLRGLAYEHNQHPSRELDDRWVITDSNDELAVVSLDGIDLMSLFDLKKGVFICPDDWFYTINLGNISNNIAIVTNDDGKENYFDISKRKVISDTWFDTCFSFDIDSDIAIVNNDEKETYIRRDGKFLFNEWFDKCEPFDEKGIARVFKKNLVTLIRKDGSFVKDVWFENIKVAAVGIYIGKHPVYGCLYFTYEGKTLFGDFFDDASAFDENGIAIAKQDGKFTYLKKDGTFLSNMWFSKCERFARFNCAIVEMDNKQNLLRMDGTLVLDKWVDECSNFQSNGIAIVTLNYKDTYIKTDGSLLINDWFDLCGRFYHEKLACVVKDGKENLVTSDGSYLLDTWFDHITYQGAKLPHYFIGKYNNDDKMYKIDFDGNIIPYN